MESTTWELSKENIQPLKKGRKMDNLQPALQQQADCQLTKLRQEKSAYALAIETYEGDDPLEPWCAYMDWSEQNFPKGGNVETIELLRSCVSKFREEQRYHNDQRFVSMLLALADLVPEPLDIYGYMKSKGIGTRLAEFYVSWALELEMLGKMRSAEQVYQEGLNMNAEPRDELIQRHTQFSARMIHISVDKNATTDATISEEHRAILGPLKPRGRRHLVGTCRVGAAKLGGTASSEPRQSVAAAAPVSQRSRRQKPIAVFVDENGAAADALPVKTTQQLASQPLPGTQEAVKENERHLSKWTEATIAVKTPATISAVKFEVHVDEDVGQSKNATSQKALQATNALSAKKVKAQDVMKAIRDDADKKPEAVQGRYQFCITKLHSKQGELQFEELRAARWRKKNEPSTLGI